MNYPKHLPEKIREEIAVSYLKHELRKIFPSIKSEEIENLMDNKSLAIPRDFWNGVHGIGMGFKLHIGFIYLLTAGNIKWNKEIIKIEDLNFGTDRENTQLLGSKSIKKLMDFYKTNQSAWNEAKEKLEKSWVGDEQMELDPIIINEKMDGLTVYEGHNRTEKFMFENRSEIEAYVGRYTTEIKRPMNFWVPTSLLMDNLYFVYQAIDDKDEAMFEAQIKVLKNMVKDSESGREELVDRALTNKEPHHSKIITALGELA